MVELMELRHKQTKVALAERRLRYLDYQKRYYQERIATDSERMQKRRQRSSKQQKSEPINSSSFIVSF